MNLMDLAERAVLPDWLIRVGIRHLLAERLRTEEGRNPAEPRGYLREFVEELRRSPIALATDSANLQHYEVECPIPITIPIPIPISTQARRPCFPGHPGKVVSTPADIQAWSAESAHRR